MSNPFRKRPTLDASERTKQKKTETMMKVLNSKPSNHSTKNYTLTNDKLTSTLNHAQKLEYTRGFYSLECNCDDIQPNPNHVIEGKYSVVDWSTIEHVNLDPCITNPVYELDECRIQKGLIVPLAQLETTHRDRKLKYPMPIQKTSECCRQPLNNIEEPKYHEIESNLPHNHYFPMSNKIGYYNHRHDLDPHGENGTYPHLHKETTNMYSVMTSLSQNMECCDKNTHE